MIESDQEMLRQAMFETVGDQIRDRNPPAAKHAFDRMTDEGYSKQDAKGLIATVMVMEMSRVLAEGKVYNEERYVGWLNDLPQLPPDD